MNAYKETIREFATELTKKIWKIYKLEPNFKMRKLVEQLGGNIAPDLTNQLADYEEAEIFEEQSKESFNIIYKLRCPITDEDRRKLESNRERNFIIDAHLEDRRIRHAIAHEIGHLFLHMIKLQKEENFIIEGDYKRNIQDGSLIEWEAEEFASILLMPEQSFRFYYERLELTLDNEFERIDKLAETFGALHSDVIKRGRNLQLW